jgi:pilus assembly protein Flp/PilA
LWLNKGDLHWDVGVKATKGTAMSFVKEFLRDESGATAIEYGLIAALVAVVLVTAIGTMGNKLSKVFQTVSSSLP